MKTTITKVAAVVMTVLMTSFTSYADIVVTAPTVTICPGTSTATIAFTVTGAQNLGSISMKVAINHSVLFNTPFTMVPNPALQMGGFVTGNVTANPPYVIAFAWFGTSGANIPDGEAMVTFTVPYLGGSCPLHFNNIGVDCVMSNPNGDDIPTTWIDGSVGPAPTLAINTQPQNLTVIQGNDAVFSVAPNFATTYQWQESIDGGNSWGDLIEGTPYSGVNTENLTIAAVTAAFDNYQYRCYITAPCSQSITSDAALLVVSTVVPVPIAFDMTGGGIICEGSPGISFGLSGSEADATYELYLDGAGTGYIIPGTGDPLSFDNITVAGTYTIIGTNTFGSTTMNGFGILTVNPLPMVELAAFSPVCADATPFLLGGGTPEGGTYSGLGVGDNMFYPSVSGAGIFEITYSYVDVNGCSGSATANLTVNELPDVTWTETLPVLCTYSAPLELTGGTPAGGVYSGISVEAGYFNPTNPGDYTLTYIYTDGNNCTASASNTITVLLSEIFDVTGGGSFCEGNTGVNVGLSGSQTGVDYELFLNDAGTGNILPGTGSALDFGLQTAAGMYTVVATNTCGNFTMNGNATVSIDPLPTVYTVSGGGFVCEGTDGVTITLSGSDNGAMYFMFNGPDFVTSLPGDGNPLTFGPFNIPGTYTIFGEYNIDCGTDMAGSASIIINTNPTTFVVSGGGNVCPGSSVNILLSNSEVGVEEGGVRYYLYLDNISTGLFLLGTGAPLTFENITDAGIYTIVAVTSCGEFQMDGSADVTTTLALTQFNVSGGGEICPTLTGVSVLVDGSEVNVNYELYRDGTPTGNILEGTGSALEFGSLFAAGTYTVVATSTCGTLEMNGSAVATVPAPIIITLQPVDVTINEGGNATFTLAADQVVAAQWQVSLDGGTSWTDLTEMAPYTGVTSLQLDITNAGTEYNGMMYRCAIWNPACMPGTWIASASAILTVNAVLPDIIVSAPEVDDAIAGNTVIVPVTVQYVNNVAAISLSLGFDPSVLSYTGYQNEDVQLAGGMLLINQVGNNIKFGWFSVTPISIASGTLVEYIFTFNGGYSDLTWDQTPGECQFTDLTPVILNATYTNGHVTGICPLPLAYNVTGGGTYCSGGTGVIVGLENSEASATYELFLDGLTTGLIVTGTGTTIDFGLQTSAGIYSVVATNICGNTDMTGQVEISTLNGPVAFTVSGDITGCSGPGYVISISGSETGVTYELFRNGLTTGVLNVGDGYPFGLNVTEDGVYTVFATNTCGTVEMTGSATIIFFPDPTVFDVIGGGTVCAGTAGVTIGLNGSETGNTYDLYLNGVHTGIILPGTGLPLDFGTQTAEGNYTVTTTWPCGTLDMFGSASITSQPAIVFLSDPLPVTVNIGGSATFDVSTNIPGEYLWQVSNDGGSNYTDLADDLNYSGTTTAQLSIIDIPTFFQGNHYRCSVYDPVCGSSTLIYSAGALLTVNALPNILVTAPEIDDAIVGNQVVVPITVENVADAASISLSLGFDPTVLTYTGYQNVNAAIDNSFLSINLFGNNVKFAWFSVTPVTIASGTLVEYLFTFNGGYSPLTWDLTPGECQFTDLTPIPLAAIFKDGHVTGTCPLPLAYNVTGGGTYCTGGTGVVVGLDNSEANATYELFLDGVTTALVVTGTGSNIDFGLQTSVGVYTVVAANICGTTDMTGNAEISTLNGPTVYNVTGDATSCGGIVYVISISGSETGVSYELFRNGLTTGVLFEGDGYPFGLSVTEAGVYTVFATNTCGTIEMTGSATITIYPEPTVYDVVGGGSICAGSAGVSVGLTGSEYGNSYSLYLNGVYTGLSQAGSGSALDFGDQTAEGNYTILTTWPCGTLEMNGSAVISIIPAVVITAQPADYTVQVGNTATFSFETEPAAAMGIIWQVSTDGGATFNDIQYNYPYASVTYYILNILDVTLDMNGNQYRAKYTSLCNADYVYTDAATLYVTSIPTIITTAPSIDDAVVGNPVVVPITVENVNGAAAISLSLGFDPSVLTYVGLQNINPLLDGGMLSVNLLGSNVKLGWFSVTPISLASGTLIEYVFTFNGGYSPLIWDLSPGECEYDDIVPTPLAAVFVDGYVTGGCDLPLAYDVTGGGIYCAGGTGVAIGLSSSETGTSYELFLDGVTTGYIVSGDGNPVSFGNHTLTGIYTVVGTNPCGSAPMNGTATVTTYTLPLVFDVTGGGAYCAGGAGLAVGLAGSETGMSYELYLDGTATGNILSGDGLALDFGLQTAAGTYTVVTDFVCGPVVMNGNAIVVVNTPVFTAFNVTGGGMYCAGGAGVAVGLDGSELPYTYELYLDGTATGITLAGTGNALDFGLFTAAGTYTINAIDPCGTSFMAGNAVVSTYALPLVYDVTGGGNYCAGGTGVAVGLTGSETGMSYELYLDGTATGNILSGDGLALDFGLQTLAGTYTIVANFVCGPVVMNGNAIVVVNTPVFTAFNVSGGGMYCAGGAGVSVGLDGSELPYTYELYLDGTATGITLAGTGNALDFGLFTAAGTYTINAIDPCGTSFMTGNAVVSTYTLPLVYDVTGGGNYCAGGTGVAVGLTGSETGMSYELYLDGTATGNILPGDGLALDFGLQTAAGTYTVVTDFICGPVVMNGNAIVVVNTPVFTAFNVTGGGIYCAGGAGVSVGLDGSELPYTYELYLDGTATGITLAGTGNALDFGLFTAAGTYTINAIDPCGTSFMTGNAIVSTYALPLVYNVTGGGSYCAGGAGLAVGLDGSETGMSYELYLDGTATGNILSGDGLALDFGLQTTAGTYTVVTDFICGPVAMNGNAVVVVNTPVFMAFNVTGGGVICSGGAGVNIGLDGSESAYTYELYLDGLTTGITLAGTGLALDFGTFNGVGTYTVVAIDVCGTALMTGNAIITLAADPLVFTMTGGGSFCTGATGFDIGLNGSEIGINYELYLDGVTTGIIVTGTGAAISFGIQTQAGTYTSFATGLCGTVAMNGNAVITAGANIALFDVQGGGSYLFGGSGVPVFLSGSEPGVNYQLLLNGSPVGGLIAGTGSPLSFGDQTLPGTYTVNAIAFGTNCEQMMNGGVMVIIIPIIVDQPGDTSIFEGFGASFTVNALGATVYQWQISTDGGLTFSNLSENNPFFNVNTATLNIYGAPLSFSGYKFRCLVSNPGSPVLASNAGTLIVTLAPTLTTIAPTMTAAPGTLIAVPITVLGFDNVAAFNLTMNYDASIMTPAGIQNENGALLNGNEFQLINTSIPGKFLMAYYSMVPVSIGNGTLLEILYNFIDGSTPLTWQLTPAEGAQYGTLFGQVIPSIWIDGYINSTNSIVITDQPDNATACEGGSVTYSVTASGATTYQWVVTPDYGQTWIPLIESPMFVGVNTNNLIVNGVSSSMSTFRFACRVDYGLSTAVVSNLASLIIVNYDIIDATIVTVPSTIVCPGDNVTFSVTSPVDLTGASYIWYINSIPASSSASFSTTSLADGDVIKVDVMLSTTCVVADVPTVTMIVDPQPVVTTDPVDAIVVVGDDPTFSVIATAITGPVAYQWQISTDNGATFADLTETPPYSGVNSAILQITDATLPMDGYQFRCIVTESLCGNTDISGNAVLYVFPAPIITYAPDVVVCDEEQIVVPITVDNFIEVGSASLKLNFDPAIMTYTGYQNANPLLTTPPPAPNASMFTVVNTGSQISIFWYSTLAVDIPNGGLIAELLFTPVSPGVSPLTWDPTFGSCMYTDVAAIPIPDIYIDGSVTVNPLPIVYNVIGGGEYCIGDIGLEVGLDGSESGINYELFLDGVTTGQIIAGTGSPVTFGYQLPAGIYTVVGTNVTTLCVSDMAGSATIIINPLPIVTWTNTLTTLCQSSEVYLLTGGTPAGGTYSGPGVTGNNFSAFEAGPGWHTLTYTYMDDNGCVNFATNTIFVIDGPDPFPVTGGGSYCQGGQGVLVGLANSETTIIYQLFIDGINSGSPVFGTGGVINFGYQTVPGVYTVVGLNLFNGCTQLMIGSVTVTEIVPNVTWPATLPDICQNSSPYPLTGGLPAGGTYSGNGVIGGFFDPVIAGNGVHVLTYTYTDTYGCSGSATNTIVVHPGPDVTFSPLPDICLTAPAFDLNTYVTPVGGTFSGTGVTGSMFDPSVAGAGPQNITYTFAANICSVIITRSINVLPLPVVSWTNILESQCVDATAYFLTGAMPAGGVYSGPGVTGNVFNASLAGVGTHTLTYTYTDVNGCINSTTNTITVNALPVVTWTEVLPNQCENALPFALTGGIPAGGVYSGPGVIGGDFNAIIAGVGVHTLTYTYTDPVTNCTDFTTNTITVVPVPVVTFNTLPDVCLNGFPVSLATFVTPVGGTFSGTGVSGDVFDPAVAGIGLHTITYTYTLNGCTVIVSRNINVYPLPVIAWTNTLESQCIDATGYFLTGGSPAGGVYSGPGVTGNVFNASLAGVGTHTLTYTYTDINGCVNSTTNTITVNALPIVTWTEVLPNQCENALPFALTGGLPAGGVYSGPGIIGGVFNASIAGIGVHTLTYTYTDPVTNCTNFTTNTITVVPVPVVTFNTLPDVCLNGFPVSLATFVTPVGGTFSGTGVSGDVFDPAVAGIGLHTITYTYTLNGCTVIVSRNINVYPLPVIAWTNTLESQCIDATAYFLTGGSPAGGVYSGPGVTGNVFNASLAGVGTHTLTYTYTDINGCVNSTTNTITVNALPVVTWTEVLPNQCENALPFALSGGAPAGGVYSGPGIIGGVFNPSIAGVGVHTLTYTYTDPVTNCTDFITNTITVVPVPVVTFNTLPDVCINGLTLSLATFVTPVGGTFSGTGVTGDVFDPAVAGLGLHTITYTYTLNGCTVIVSRNINVIPAPTVSWTTILPAQCVDVTAYYLSGGTPAGGFYSGPGVIGNLFNPSLVGPGTYTFTYTYSDPATGCTGSTTNTIVVNPLPIVSWTTAPISVCVDGASVTLEATPAGGIFSGPGVVGNVFNPALTGPGNFVINYAYIDANGCSGSADLSVTVNPLPVVTFAGTLPPVCVTSTTYVLSSGTPAGGTYSGPGVTGTNFNASVAGVGTHTIIYTYTDGNGCTNFATNSIVVVPTPVVTWTTVLPAVCENGDPFILTGALPTGGIYSGPGVVSNVFDPSLAGAGVHTLTYTFTDGFGCTSSITNTVTVNALPVITWAGALADLCIDAAPIVLSGALPTGGTYTGTGVVGGVFDPMLAGSGNFIITYTYTDPLTGCTNSETKNITVNPLPLVTFTGSFPVLCSNSTTFNLSTGSPAGGTYSGPGVTGTNFDASVAGVGTHTIIYTYTDPTTGCTNFATNTITVSGAPLVTWIGALPSVCVNENNVPLTGGLPAGGVYSGPFVIGNVFNASLAGAGTFTLTYTYVDNASGCSATATNTITVYPLPLVTFTGVLPNQCITATSYTLSGGSPAGGTYSGSGVVGNSFNASVAGLGTHVITYTYTDGNGCINSATNTISVVNLPVVTFNTALNDLCISSTSYTLTGGSPAGGVYSGAGVTGTNFNASVAGIGTHVITYTYTDANGCINSATNLITVHGLPSVTFGGTLVTQCVSSTSYLLTGGLPGGGTYTGPGVSGNFFNASVAGVGLHTITYTYTDGYGCTNSATNTINVVGLPTVSWSNALTPQCENATNYLLSGGTPIGGVYSGPGVNGTNFNASLVGPGTYTLTYTFTDGNNCVASANNTIVVNALPNVIWNTVLDPQCVTATSYVLTGGTPAGGTYSGPGVTGNTFNASSLVAGTYTLTYTYTDPSTGCTNSTTNTITVQNLPAVFFPGILPAQCVSSTNLALNTGVPAGGTYSGPGVVGNNFNASVAGVGTWTITYTYTNAAGCTNSATNTVTVNPLPNVTWTNTLTAQCAGNTTYALTGALPLGGVYSGPGVSGSNFDASAVGVGTYTLTYTFTDGNGCVNTANNSITVVAMPTVDLGPDQGVCFGTTTTLTATATPPSVTYLWNTAATTQSINVIAGDTTTYYITVTTTDGCTAVDSVVVIPLPLPTAGATANPITICAGESTIVSASGGSGSTPYLWNTTSTLQTWVSGPLTDTTYYTVTVMNTYGCIDIATVRVNVNMIPIVSLGPDIIACENYTVTLSPTGSTPFDNFLWNNGLETPTLDVDSTGYGLNNPATYTVTVTLNGCQAKDAVIVTFVPCPGFDEIGKDEKIVVYPNPTDGLFTVSIENYDKPLQFYIYNNIGQLLYSEKLQNNSLSKYTKDFDLSRYPTGFYILRFTDGDKVKSKKLIVK
ncbi:MAG: cohesin domain-containing protein [Bacteroidales bacterium]